MHLSQLQVEQFQPLDVRHGTPGPLVVICTQAAALPLSRRGTADQGSPDWCLGVLESPGESRHVCWLRFLVQSVFSLTGRMFLRFYLQLNRQHLYSDIFARRCFDLLGVL